MKTITAQGLAWIDIHKPTESHLEKLKERFSLHPLITKRFLPALHRPTIEEYPDQLFMVIHFPVHDKKTRTTKTAELDFIVTKEAVITSHTENIPEIETFFNDCKLQKYHQDRFFVSSGALLFGILDWLINSCLPMLDHVSEHLEGIEKEVFEGKEKEMLMEIAIVKRDIINFRRAIKPQRSVLEILGSKAVRLYGKEVKTMSQEVIGSLIRVWNVLESHRELINSIEQTNNSLLSYKLSDIMKFLTVVSFITFPLSVIVGFFGMNVFNSLPIVRENIHAWWIILISMFLTTAIMVIYFRKKKWL